MSKVVNFIKEYFKNSISNEKKLSTWLKRGVCLAIWFIIKTYYKTEFTTMVNTLVSFFLNNYILIIRGFGIFTVLFAVLISIWFIVMLFKVGIEGIDELFDTSKDLVVQLLKFIFHKVLHY